VGVTIAKKTIPMIIGETKLPKKIPNLNQILFSGVKTFEFSNPKNKKNIAIIKDQILISPSLNNGNIETIKKNRKKTTPKFLLDEILILFEFINLFENYLIKKDHIYIYIFLIPLIIY